MTLKTICEDALNEIGSIDVPDVFAGSQLPTSKLCLALANRSGRSLERRYRFNSLIAEHTFVTVADQAAYDLPDDFRAFANMSVWDRTNDRFMQGGVSSSRWQWFQSGVTNNTINRFYMVRGTSFTIYPTPSVAGETIAFDYYSKNWVQPSSGANKAKFDADTDNPLIDDQLVTMDVKWRFLASKGFPAEIEYKEYVDHLMHVLADQNGMQSLNTSFQQDGLFDNMPETGFGA